MKLKNYPISNKIRLINYSILDLFEISLNNSPRRRESSYDGSPSTTGWQTKRVKVKNKGSEVNLRGCVKPRLRLRSPVSQGRQRGNSSPEIGCTQVRATILHLPSSDKIVRDNRISLNTLRARRPYRRLRPRAIASKFKRSGAIVDWETKTRRGRGKDKPDHLEDGSRYPLCREKRSRTKGGGRGDLESIRFRFWLLHRHAKREIYVVPSLVDSLRRFFFLLIFCEMRGEKDVRKRVIIVLFFPPFFLFWLTMITEKKFNLIEFHFDAISREVFITTKREGNVFLVSLLWIIFRSISLF